jgi:hypothetical protein
LFTISTAACRYIAHARMPGQGIRWRLRGRRGGAVCLGGGVSGEMLWSLARKHVG